MSNKKGDSKINSYVITHATMKKMETLIKDTHKTGKEHGMSLCVEKDGHRIKEGIVSKGTDRGIEVSEECKEKNERYVGSFHTHPSDSETAPSAQDLHSSCLSMSSLDCIGKNKIGEIVCFDKKIKGSSCLDDVKPLKDIEDIFHEIPFKNLPRIKKELYSEVDKVTDQHFDIHKIK